MIIEDDGGGALHRRAGVAANHKQQHLAGSGFRNQRQVSDHQQGVRAQLAVSHLDQV